MFNVYHGDQEREGNCKQLLQFVVLSKEIIWNEAFWRIIFLKKTKNEREHWKFVKFLQLKQVDT